MTLNFNLTVTANTGSHGLSSIMDILSGSAINSADNSLVSATLNRFNVTATPASITSNIGATATSTTFTLTSNPLSFDVRLGVASENASNTVGLSNVRLLFQPAPEPASIGLLVTGLSGLAALRCRSKRRVQQPDATI